MRISDWSSDVCSSDLLRQRSPEDGLDDLGDVAGGLLEVGGTEDRAHLIDGCGDGLEVVVDEQCREARADDVAGGVVEGAADAEVVEDDVAVGVEQDRKSVV